MKYILLALFTVFSLEVVQASYDWRLTSVQDHYADNIEDLSELAKDHPELFKDIDLTEVFFATTDEKVFSYIGQTVCEEGDSRLVHHEQDVMICFVENIECISKLPSIPMGGDPCGDENKNYRRPW